MNDLSPVQHLFDSNLLAEIQKCGTFSAFEDGATIMEYDRYVQMLPIVIEGTIKVYKKDEKGNELLLYYLSVGDSCCIAYYCCLETKKSQIKAIAEGNVRIVSIPQQKLDSWICEFTSWRKYIMQGFNHRFLELLKSIESIAFQKLDERLINYLKDKQRIGKSSIIKESHQNIAEEMSTSRVVISRLLKHLENENKVLLYRNEIKILAAL